jgi:putative transcriptional regulator
VRLLLLILLALLSFLPASSPAREAEPGSLTGQFLVATSQLREPGFRKTVIYMVKHSADGAMGIIVNRPLGKVSLAALSKKMGLEEAENQDELTVYYGGPVESDRGFVLHSTEATPETSRIIGEGVAMTADSAILKFIAEGEGPEHYIFALGYAGWAPNQLEVEIAQGSWLTYEFELSILFAEDPEKTWEVLTGKRIFRL